jgi:hypothetical protein
MAEKTIFIFVSVNFQIKFFIELDLWLRNPVPFGKGIKNQPSYISPGMGMAAL